jgi:hypothetical protein
MSYCRADWLVAYDAFQPIREGVMTNLLSTEQTTDIKDPFAGAEITDADFNRIEVISDLIRQTEIVDMGKTHES